MRLLSLFRLALVQVRRHPTRSALAVLGVATGMFLFTAVETIQGAAAQATAERDDTSLIVFRESRFCPSTSRLPERYASTIAGIEGVRSVIPISVVTNNCRTSLDVVTFRGIDEAGLRQLLDSRLELTSGSFASWTQRMDSALLGSALAHRRSLSVGDSFAAAGIQVQVSGIFDSSDSGELNLAYVPQTFIQQASRLGLGQVTQFEVQVSDPARSEAVASAIDAAFRSESEPTATRPRQAFLAQTAGDLLNLVGFTRYVGLGAVAAVLALVFNTISLAMRSRIAEFAVLQTLGFRLRDITILILTESACFALLGGLLGVASAAGLLIWGGFSLSNEGLSIVFVPRAETIMTAALVALGIGISAGLLPAWRAARRPIADSLRMGA